MRAHRETVAVRFKPALLHALAAFLLPYWACLVSEDVAFDYPWRLLPALLPPLVMALFFMQLRARGFAYLTADTSGVRHVPVALRIRTDHLLRPRDRLAVLHPGDALVATGEQLFVRRGHAGVWEATGIRARWARLRAWTGSVWPGRHPLPRAVVE